MGAGNTGAVSLRSCAPALGSTRGPVKVELAERTGFEPVVGLLTLRRFSKPLV